MTDLPTALREWRGPHPARVAADALGVNRRTYEGWEGGKLTDEVKIALLRCAILTPIDAMIEINQPGGE